MGVRIGCSVCMSVYRSEQSEGSFGECVLIYGWGMFLKRQWCMDRLYVYV